MFNSDLIFEHNYGSSRPKKNELAPLVSTKLFSFADPMEGFSIARFEVGPNDDPLILVDNLSHWPREGPLSHADREEYLRFEAMMESNKKLLAAGEGRFKIIHFNNGDLVDVDISQSVRDPLQLQPLGADHYLLCARLSSDSGKINENGIVIDRSGNVVERLVLGCCIEAMKTTKNGNIWTCYFDEGVYSDDPISQKGVGCFDRHGKHLYPDEYNSIFADWCYNINVEADDSVWFSPSMTGLVKIENFMVKTISAEQHAGLGVFAIFGEHALWAPSYPNIAAVDFFVISNLKTSGNKYFQAVDDDGQVIKHEYYAACGSKMYFVANHDVYVIDLEDIQI